jgi:hypothetical protein
MDKKSVRTIYECSPRMAGMNRYGVPSVRALHGVPRAGGDEPLRAVNADGAAGCSPRMRG